MSFQEEYKIDDNATICYKNFKNISKIETSEKSLEELIETVEETQEYINENVNTDEILGINNNLLVDSKIDYTNLISYVSSSLFIMINNRVSRHINAKIKFEISFHPSVEDTFDFSKMIYNESERNRSIHKGTLLAENLIILYNGNNLGDDTSIGTTNDTDRPNDTNEKETIPY